MAFHYRTSVKPVQLGLSDKPAHLVTCICCWSHIAATRWLAIEAYRDHKRGAS